MKIILIRHGSREDENKVEDKDKLLSAEGREQTGKLGDVLSRLDLRPELYLTSTYKHAKEMGNILSKHLDVKTPPPVLSLDALTPRMRTATFEDIIDEAEKEGIDLSQLEVVTVIGHEHDGRLSRLLTRLTSVRARPFNRAEAACLTAPAFDDFLRGRGEVEFRLPVVDYHEDKLRPKIRSKLTVATFLAGFTFTALIRVLQETTNSYAPLQIVATIALTAALALFIAAVYMYDQLSMPEGFWVYGDRGRSRSVRGDQFESDWRQQGPLYAYMVWTWTYVFTPAVALGLLGFLAILLNTRQVFMIRGGLIVIIAVLAYYVVTRPRLGTD
ncbi:SixA phosphatase family protein [Petrachloros mirabilis]